MQNKDQFEAQDPKPDTSWSGQARKERSGLVKEFIGGLGPAATTALGTFIGTRMGNPTAGTMAGVAVGSVLGPVFKFAGSVVGGVMDARREAKSATSSESGGGGTAVAAAGAVTIGAVKSIVFAASQAAKDGGARITGMKAQVEEVLAMLNGALDGTSSGEVQEALGYLGEAADVLEGASKNAGGVANTATQWAAAL